MKRMNTREEFLMQPSRPSSTSRQLPDVTTLNQFNPMPLVE